MTDNKAITLESFRVIACLIVVVSHVYEFSTGVLDNYYNELISYIAVAVFFFISGIVNTWSFQRKPSIKAFYRSRFKRIYPTYFIAVTIGIIFLSMVNELKFSDFFNYAFLQPLVGTISTNAPLWSLSYEVVLYAVLPFIFNTYKPLNSLLVVLIVLLFFIFSHEWLVISFFAGHFYARFKDFIPFKFDFFARYGKYTYEVYVYHYPLLLLIFALLR